MSAKAPKPPPVSKALIAYLETLYPYKLPDISDSERKIFKAIGNVEVIEFLKVMFARQERDKHKTARSPT